MDQKTYAVYVQIDCWQIRRTEYVRKHSWCEVCGLTPHESDELHDLQILDVHHLSYEHLGNERDEELVSLCRLCHSMFHDKTLEAYRMVALSSLKAANLLLEIPKRTLMIEILKAKTL